MIRFLITATDSSDNKRKHFIYSAPTKEKAAEEIKEMGFKDIVAYAEKPEHSKQIDDYLKSIGQFDKNRNI